MEVFAQQCTPPELITLARLFQEANAPLFVVGGLPRNACFSLPPSDIDICSAMLPEDVVTLCHAQGIHCVDTAIRFGTIAMRIGDILLEHTTFRAECYHKGGAHRPSAVHFGATLEQDAFRRDFTCNALYMEILTGKLFDPTGGQEDIRHRLLRATSADPAVIMRDDGLRVLRLVRFACELGFTIEEKTWNAAKAHVTGLADIAWERKRDELIKILLSDTRYPALTGNATSPVLRGLHLLYELGAFPYLLPALLEGDGVPQRPQFHAYDVLRHNLQACAAAQPTLVLRLAGLLHDVGKPAALREKGLQPNAGGHYQNPPALPQGITPMLNHDTLGVPIAQSMLLTLRFPQAVVEDVLFLVAHHMYDLNFGAKESTLRMRFAEMGYPRALLLCAIREADVRGSGYCLDFVALRWRRLLQRMQEEGAPFSLEALACTGQDIMDWLGLPPGPQVGEIKRRMLRHCARRPQDNTRERLQRLAKGMLQ